MCGSLLHRLAAVCPSHVCRSVPSSCVFQAFLRAFRYSSLALCRILWLFPAAVYGSHLWRGPIGHQAIRRSDSNSKCMGGGAQQPERLQERTSGRASAASNGVPAGVHHEKRQHAHGQRSAAAGAPSGAYQRQRLRCQHVQDMQMCRSSQSAAARVLVFRNVELLVRRRRVGWLIRRGWSHMQEQPATPSLLMEHCSCSRDAVEMLLRCWQDD